VNDHYQTSDPLIYAIGDAIIVKQTTTNQDTLISLASPANRQGRQVADVLAGKNRLNRGSLGTAIVRVFEMAGGSTGLNESQLQAAGLTYQVLHLSGKSNAGYFPGAETIWLKLLFQPQTGELFGAQAVGPDGVDKRIDVLATAIKAGLTVDDLPELELSYAPPFGSAKDIINLAGYAAQNLMAGDSQSVQWHELAAAMAAGAQLVDVREPAEHQQGAIPGAINIPLDDLRQRMSELPKSNHYIVSCASGLRSYLAERILKQNGYQVQNLDGAYALYALMQPKD
jgi:rhodanese-related sulfurtransferase